MNKGQSFLKRIPSLLASPVSIFIYVFLFFYLVIFSLAALLLPVLQPYQPSSSMQLILGNYTNVLSALGASIAAGTTTVTHASLKKLHQKHDELQKSLVLLHQKIDALPHQPERPGSDEER